MQKFAINWPGWRVSLAELPEAGREVELLPLVLKVGFQSKVDRAPAPCQQVLANHSVY
jgi:hypothetical protein